MDTLEQGFLMLTPIAGICALDRISSLSKMGRNSGRRRILSTSTERAENMAQKAAFSMQAIGVDDTLTEDLDLSYRAQRKGWKFVYRPEIESPAELPPDTCSAIKSQQFRWTKGGAECAVKHAGTVSPENLFFRVKFHSFAHLFNSAIFIAVLVTSS